MKYLATQPESKPTSWVFLFSGMVFLMLPYAWMGSLGDIETKVPSLLLWLGMAFATYWVFSVEGKLDLSSLQILVLGLFLRLCLLPMPACDDMHRYIWEGRMWNLGFNPYQLAPDAPDLAQFRNAQWALINHPNIPTLYPPVAEFVFACLARISTSAWLFKAAFIGFDLAGFLMLRRLQQGRIPASGATAQRIEAIYFLNPLLILETAGRGHFDSIAIFFNVAFIWALAAEETWSPLNLALGVLTKINSLALTPLLFFRLSLYRALMWTGAILALTVGSFFATGLLGTLGRFTTQFRYNSMVPYLIESALAFVSPTLQKMLSLALMALIAAYFFRSLRQARPENQALNYMGLLLCFSPTLHSWYLLWILPFAALTLSRPWLLLTGTVMLTYLVYGRAVTTGYWREIPWLRYPEFLPPLALWLYLKFKSRLAPT